jgi:hypothetical protein
VSKDRLINNSLYRIIFILVLIVSGLTFFIGYQPVVIEIESVFSKVEKQTLISIYPKIKSMGFVDARETDIVDTFYSQVSPPLHWVIKSDIVNILSDALNSELKNSGYYSTSDQVDYYLHGKVLEIKLDVVQRYPEIIEGTIKVNMILENAKNKNIEWARTVTGIGVDEGKGDSGGDQSKVVISAIKDFIINVRLADSLPKGMI